MNPIIKYLLQGVCYIVFGWLVVYFSMSPSYHYLRGDQAEVQLAFRHATDTVEPCRQRSAEELAKLPPNMRRAKDCPRERSPLKVVVELDEQVILERTINPTGLHRDLSVYAFLQMKVPVGDHRLRVRMNDSVRVEGYNYQHQADVSVKPGQVLVVTLDEESKTFIFR